MTADIYSCTYTRATVYYIGAALGVVVGVLIMHLDVSLLWRYITVIGSVAFFGGSALYYDLMSKNKKGGTGQRKDEEL